MCFPSENVGAGKEEAIMKAMGRSKLTFEPFCAENADVGVVL